jgi:hypothetical protein
MELLPVKKVENIDPEEFRNDYYNPMRPIVISGLAKQWPALERWNWDLFKEVVGNVRVGVYNNVKSDAYTPINTADDYMLFGDYIDMVRKVLQNGEFFCSIFLIMLHSLLLTLPGRNNLLLDL